MLFRGRVRFAAASICRWTPGIIPLTNLLRSRSEVGQVCRDRHRRAQIARASRPPRGSPASLRGTRRQRRLADTWLIPVPHPVVHVGPWCSSLSCSSRSATGAKIERPGTRRAHERARRIPAGPSAARPAPPPCRVAAGPPPESAHTAPPPLRRYRPDPRRRARRRLRRPGCAPRRLRSAPQCRPRPNSRPGHASFPAAARGSFRPAAPAAIPAPAVPVPHEPWADAVAPAPTPAAQLPDRGWRRIAAAGDLRACQAGAVAPRNARRLNSKRPSGPSSHGNSQGRRAGQGRRRKDVGGRQRRIALRRTASARPRRGDRRRYRVRPIGQPNRSAVDRLVLGADADQNLRSFTDVVGRLGRNSVGLHVLGGEPASGPRRVLDPAIYREAALRLDRHFTISVIDCWLDDGRAGHPGGPSRSGCADRRVLAVGGWGLRGRQDHGVAVGSRPDEPAAQHHRGAQRFRRPRRQTHPRVAGAASSSITASRWSRCPSIPI